MLSLLTRSTAASLAQVQRYHARGTQGVFVNIKFATCIQNKWRDSWGMMKEMIKET